MKVRIGVGTGAATPTGAEEFDEAIEAMERLGFDSVWLSEVLTAPTVDPMVGMAYAAGRVRKLKIGTTMVFPGRNPIRLAKELATLDQLCGGRLLATAVIGLRQPRELAALGVAAEDRGPIVDEMMPLLRRLWEEDAVDHTGRFFHYEGASVDPKPLQQPLEMWLGGNAPSALVRAGRLSDGWLPALCTPAEAEEGRRQVLAAAEAAGRTISEEHFGVSIGYSHGEPPERLLAALSARRPELDVRSLVPVGYDALEAHLRAFLDVGFSKFVVRPNEPPSSWTAELEALADAVLGLQTPSAKVA